jgi:hypothetical protein
MQSLDLFPGRRRGSRVMMAVAAALWVAGVASAEQGTVEPKPYIPTIVLEDVPLIDVIKNLARQADLNYIIAPEVMAAPKTNVTARWENLTAKGALDKLLAEHDLALVENPETTVVRIATTNGTRKPAFGKWLTAGTNAPIPLLVMDDVPLDRALLSLVRQAGLDAVPDPRWVKLHEGGAERMPEVSFRWEDLTPRQALAALLDNYDLVIDFAGPTQAARILPTKWADAEAKAAGKN